MARDDVVLEVDQVSRSFGALAALSGVSFSVSQGEVFSVIGPNGAGKSTLFNVVSGLYPPSAGRVRFLGEEITGLPPEVVNRRGLAKTFQITNVFREISVFERFASQNRSCSASVGFFVAACPPAMVRPEIPKRPIGAAVSITS